MHLRVLVDITRKLHGISSVYIVYKIRTISVKDLKITLLYFTKTMSELFLGKLSD